MSQKLDLSYLEEITGGDNEIMLEMIDIFLTESEIAIQELQTIYEQNDWQALGAQAHKLKPTLLYVGLKDIHEITLKLEKNAKQGTMSDQYELWIQQITQGYNDIRGDLEAVKQKLSA
jgi:HPt (histidine-containing phosphotransfer) domain-containing protein